MQWVKDSLDEDNPYQKLNPHGEYKEQHSLSQIKASLVGEQGRDSRRRSCLRKQKRGFGLACRHNNPTEQRPQQIQLQEPVPTISAFYWRPEEINGYDIEQPREETLVRERVGYEGV